MKKPVSLLFLLPLIGLLTGTLAACSPAGDPAPPDANSARREAFAALLRTAHDDLTLPDGSALGGNSAEEVEGNLFTVFDVDGDGQEELILIWSNTITAGMTELVYGYDDASGDVLEELREFPGVIFYNNGAAEAPWSHNQGLAGDFWPYNLYQYSAATGKYESAGSADAWDSSLDSDRFPKDADADGSGMVYYLLPPNWDGQYNAPVDDADYVQWRDSLLKGADFLDLSFVPLTAENIARMMDGQK